MSGPSGCSRRIVEANARSADLCITHPTARLISGAARAGYCGLNSGGASAPGPKKNCSHCA